MSDSKATTPSVDYVWLGPNAGIKVSNLCLGTMTFGIPNTSFSLPGNTDEVKSHEILDRFYELGGNFIDTANVYTGGQSEQIIGSWMKKLDRSSVVIATKVRFSVNSMMGAKETPSESGLGRASILLNVDQSLKRLGTDYIDLYYSHCWDSGVKLEETLRTFNDVVRSGKVLYLGVSNVTGSQLQKIVDYSKFMGFDDRVVLQQEYNLLERGSEVEVFPTCLEEGVAVVPYGALKGGLLTGKFKRDEKDVAKALEGSRLAWTAEKPKERTRGVAPYVENYRENEDYWKLMDAMSATGKAHGGKTTSQVAIRWLLQKKYVSSVLIGAKNIQQLEDCMAAGTGWKLADQEMQELDNLSSFALMAPSYPYEFVKRVNANRDRCNH